jgi:hypothetical protein
LIQVKHQFLFLNLYQGAAYWSALLLPWFLFTHYMIYQRFRFRSLPTLLFVLFIMGAAVSELTQAPAVVLSAQALQLPYYLLYVLAGWKLLGVCALVFSRQRILKEWAYAGFFFNLSGAVCCLLIQAPILPDMAVAPAALALLLLSYQLDFRARG